jgi:hypothetical protein
MEKQLSNVPRYHFLAGTPGIVTIHTAQKILKGETVTIGTKQFNISEVKVSQISSYYIGFNFYELKFQIN